VQEIIVEAVSPQLQFDSPQIGGVVTRHQTESLPLNGRSFFELAKIELGVQPPARQSDNRILVPVMGSPGLGSGGRGTRVTVDGGSIMSVFNGGAAMGFSQEVVEEFQITSVNFDLSTGLTASGSLNTVTRSGGKDFHGSAFLFFRDHNLAAYPGVDRDSFNADPFFQRRQSGGSMGGPLIKDRVSFFASYERSEQRSVIATQQFTPEFAHLSRITPSPQFQNQFSVRLDVRATKLHDVFVRHTHDGVRLFAPTSTSSLSYPSSWRNATAWSDQSLMGITSTLRPNLVNDLRFSYFFNSVAGIPATEADCAGCLGVGAPHITVAGLDIGISLAGATATLSRRYHLTDSVNWQKGAHQYRFGGSWEYLRSGGVTVQNAPAAMTLFSPQRVREYNELPTTPPEMRIPLADSFLTLTDILQLPLQSVTVGIGDPRVLQKNFSDTRMGQIVQLYLHDTWRLLRRTSGGPRLTINYGIGWTLDNEINYDLAKPAYLASILGPANLGPVRKNWTNFSPVLGLVWSPGTSGKTVVRAGGGIYYDFQFPTNTDMERYSLGPAGTGWSNVAGSRIFNPLPGIAGVSPGDALDFRANPTLFTGANLFIDALPAIRSDLADQLNPGNRSFAVTNIEADKTGSIIPADTPNQYAIHLDAGIQRELSPGWVVSADFAFRRFINTNVGQVDFNHFNSVNGPVLRGCDSVERDDPKALCSLGAINVSGNFGRTVYKALLVRVDRRFSRGFQLLASYAYSRNIGLSGISTPGSGFNLDNWFEGYGPVLSRDASHLLNVSGILDLPRGFQLGVIVSYRSRLPFSAYVGNNDFNGDGTTGDLLPGTRVGEFNRGLGKSDLEDLVQQFNSDFAGKRDAQNRSIPFLTLPAQYEFGDGYFTQDIRLSRTFSMGEGGLTVLGECFNLFNIANLQGFSGDLTNAGFGKPTSRVDQAFGSGGPRAFQFGLRVGF
jgi:hypothetical protein